MLIGGDFNFKEIDWEDEFVEVNQPDEDGEEEMTGGNQHLAFFGNTARSLFEATCHGTYALQIRCSTQFT